MTGVQPCALPIYAWQRKGDEPLPIRKLTIPIKEKAEAIASRKVSSRRFYGVFAAEFDRQLKRRLKLAR